MSTATARKVEIGDNTRPPLVTTESLDKDYAHVVEAIDKIAEQVAMLPEAVEDEDDVAAIAAIFPRLRGAHKRAEDLRKTEKAPYLDAGKAVDGWFGKQAGRVAAWQTDLQGRVDRYTRWKAERERKQREAEAAAAREEAERQRQAAEAAASAGQTEEEIAAREAAAESENEAREAAAAAQGKAADLVRTHTPAGNTVSAKEEWIGRVTDFAKIDLNALRAHISPAEIEAAVRRFAKETKGTVELAGVSVEKQIKTIIS